MMTMDKHSRDWDRPEENHEATLFKHLRIELRDRWGAIDAHEPDDHRKFSAKVDELTKAYVSTNRASIDNIFADASEPALAAIKEDIAHVFYMSLTMGDSPDRALDGFRGGEILEPSRLLAILASKHDKVDRYSRAAGRIIAGANPLARYSAVVEAYNRHVEEEQKIAAAGGSSAEHPMILD
jgi:hypothetical protein